MVFLIVTVKAAGNDFLYIFAAPSADPQGLRGGEIFRDVYVFYLSRLNFATLVSEKIEATGVRSVCDTIHAGYRYVVLIHTVWVSCVAYLH